MFLSFWFQRCWLGRAARETRLQPFPQETHTRNAKAPATHRQRGVRSTVCGFTDAAQLCLNIVFSSPHCPLSHIEPCFSCFRMNKNKFEEDDGIDMNDIERFLPHLRSVSHRFSPFLYFYLIVFLLWYVTRLIVHILTAAFSLLVNQLLLQKHWSDRVDYDLLTEILLPKQQPSTLVVGREWPLLAW